MFLTKLKRFSLNTAFLDENNNKIEYQEILNLNKCVSKVLKKKSLVFVVSENSIESLLGYASILVSKSVIMPINIQIKNNDLINLIKKYQPNYIWCDLNFFPETILRLFKSTVGYKNYCLFEAIKKKNYQINRSLKILLSTSGSLGESKSVKLTTKNLMSNTIAISKYLKLNSKDRTISCLPWSYSYGMSIINTHLYSGGTIVVTKKSLLDKEFWSLYNFSNITNFNGVPFLYEVIKKIGFNKLINLNLKFITQAGGKMEANLSKEISKICKKKKIMFYSMYGQTEASPRMSFIEKTFKETEANCIGKPINGGSFYLKNKNNKKVQNKKEEGELVYKGKNVFVGYSKNFKDLKKIQINKELLTGDFAYYDKNKNYYLVGRKSRFIKFAGIRFSLDTIEERIKKKNIPCIALNHNEQLYIFVENTYKNTDLDKIISKTLKIRHNDFHIKFLSNFPRNYNNKISYKTLNEFLKNDK